MPCRGRLALLFGIAFLIRFILAWMPEKYLFYLVSDDAYYYFTIARNLVSHGMFSADGITVTNGFHPLWLFVITPIFAFFKTHHWLAIHLTLTVSAVFDTAAGFFIYKTLEKLGREKIGFWGSAFYLLNPFGILHTMNGLETALNNFFLALLVHLSVAVDSIWLERRWLQMGGVSGLAFLSRTDNVFALMVLWGYLVWRDHRFSPVFKMAGTAALVIAPWLVYNFTAFGSVVQTSGTAYPWMYHQQFLIKAGSYLSPALLPHLWSQLTNAFVLHAFHYGHWILTLLAAAVLLLSLRARPRAFQPLIWTLLGAMFFIAFHVFVRWSVRPWYPQAVFVLTLPAVALTFEKWKRYLVAMGMLLALTFSAKETWSTPFRKADRSRLMLEFINKKIPVVDRVGVFNSGFVQYFTDQKVINLDGLANNEVLSYFKENRGLNYFRRRDIRWLLDTPVYLGFLFGPYFGSGAEHSLAIVDALENPSYPGNMTILVRVLPEDVKAPFGREMPIWRGPPMEQRGDTIILEK